MSSTASTSIQVIIPQDGESWAALYERIAKTEGELLLVLSGKEAELIERPAMRDAFLGECKKHRKHLRIATKHPVVGAELRARGVRVFDRTKHVRMLLKDNPKLNDVLRVFSPQLWRQQLKSRLQHMGLLSVPKMRIFSLMGLSAILFYFVVFRLLPSVDVSIKARQESVSQTVNVFLVQSGAVTGANSRVRTMPLVPVNVQMRKSLIFTDISKEFIGTSSEVQLTVINKSGELYSLRKGTRFSNQAGMVFRIQEAAIVDAGKEVTVRAKADDTDIYGQIIGERGNVPAGVKWEIPALSTEERRVVYGVNRKPATGGTTAFKMVLKQQDIDVARKRLEQDLLAAAKRKSESDRALINKREPDAYMELLNYSELTVTTYTDFDLPSQYLEKTVAEVQVEGGITYTSFIYDKEAIFEMLRKELRGHVREGRRLIEEKLNREHLVVHVIDYADDLSWVKLTVDLTGTEAYVLDPLSPTGAIFGKKLRESIVGLKRSEALRIIKNMPEVESVSITQWPPWQRTIPHIGSHISIIPQ